MTIDCLTFCWDGHYHLAKLCAALQALFPPHFMSNLDSWKSMLSLLVQGLLSIFCQSNPGDNKKLSCLRTTQPLSWTWAA